LVEAVDGDGGFGFLVWQGVVSEGWAEQGFDALHGGLGAASAVVVYFDLPGIGADLDDPPDDCAAGWWWVFGAGMAGIAPLVRIARWQTPLREAHPDPLRLTQPDRTPPEGSAAQRIAGSP